MNPPFYPQTTASQKRNQDGNRTWKPGTNWIPSNDHPSPVYGNFGPNTVLQPPVQQLHPFSPEMLNGYARWCQHLQPPGHPAATPGLIAPPGFGFLPPQTFQPRFPMGMPPMDVIQSMPPPPIHMHMAQQQMLYAKQGHPNLQPPNLPPQKRIPQAVPMQQYQGEPQFLAPSRAITKNPQQHVTLPTPVPVTNNLPVEPHPFQFSNTGRPLTEDFPCPINKYQLTDVPDWCKLEIAEYRQQQERQQEMLGELTVNVIDSEARDQHQFMTPPMETSPIENSNSSRNEVRTPLNVRPNPAENAPTIRPFFDPTLNGIPNKVPPEQPPTLTPAVTPSPINSPLQSNQPSEVNASSATPLCEVPQDDFPILRSLLDRPSTPVQITESSTTSSPNAPHFEGTPKPDLALPNAPRTPPSSTSSLRTPVEKPDPSSDLRSQNLRTDGLFDPRRRRRSIQNRSTKKEIHEEVKAKKELENGTEETINNDESSSANRPTFVDLFGEDPPGRRHRKRRSTEERKDVKRHAGGDNAGIENEAAGPTLIDAAVAASGVISTRQLTGTFHGTFTGTFIPSTSAPHPAILILKSGEGDDTETIPAVISDQNITEDDLPTDDGFAKPNDKPNKEYRSMGSQTVPRTPKRETEDPEFPAPSHVCSGIGCTGCSLQDLQEILHMASLLS